MLGESIVNVCLGRLVEQIFARDVATRCSFREQPQVLAFVGRRPLEVRVVVVEFDQVSKRLDAGGNVSVVDLSVCAQNLLLTHLTEAKYSAMSCLKSAANRLE
jgi:hypothetical protein